MTLYIHQSAHKAEEQIILELSAASHRLES